MEWGREDAVALSCAGFAFAYVAGDVEEGARLTQRALSLNPNLAWAWYSSSWVKIYLGDPDTAIQHATTAIRLSPNDPQLFNMQAVVAYGHLYAHRFEEAVRWAQSAVRDRHVTTWRVLAASYALSGRQKEAAKAGEHLLGLDPSIRLSEVKNVIPLRRREDLELLVEGLRLAGVPE